MHEHNSSIDDLLTEKDEEYDELISNLKKKNEIVESAFHIAETLITQYQHENI